MAAEELSAERVVMAPDHVVMQWAAVVAVEEVEEAAVIPEAGLDGTVVAAAAAEQLVWERGRAVVQEHAVFDLELSFAPQLPLDSSSCDFLRVELY